MIVQIRFDVPHKNVFNHPFFSRFTYEEIISEARTLYRNRVLDLRSRIRQSMVLMFRNTNTLAIFFSRSASSFPRSWTSN